jgi:hypothetical protein
MPNPIDIIKSISYKAVREMVPANVSVSQDLKPWQGTDGRVSPDSFAKYFQMEISYWEEDLDTGASDIVGE